MARKSEENDRSQLEKDVNIAQNNQIARKRHKNIPSAGPAATA